MSAFPESDLITARQRNVRRATCGLMRRSKRLLDHLVRAAEQREWDREAECLGGLEVDNQLDLRGLLHRHIGRPLALEDPAGVDADLAEQVPKIGTVADQAA